MKRSAFITYVFQFALFLTVFLISSNGSVFARTPIDDEFNGKELGAKTLSPYFVVISSYPETDMLPLKETSADVNIVGVIADVTIKQKYVNTGKNTLEAIYTFPLSTKAAVYAMKMTIGSRTIVAKISEKEKARKDYEVAKTQGKRVSLLEQSRPNVFTMNVANISVKDTIVVELKYTELLVPENGVYSFVYPTVVGPRYSNRPDNESVGNNNFVNTPYTKEGELPAYKFAFNAKINSSVSIQDVSCDTHKMNITSLKSTASVLHLNPIETSGGNRDVVIDYSLQGNKIESGVMLYENGDENFFTMMIQPPAKVKEAEIPPREYVFIVDVSGSMHGFPLSISKTLLKNLILSLKPSDKFNIVLFAGQTGLLNDVSVDANHVNVDRAIKLIENQQGGGGTELLSALKKANEIPRQDVGTSRSFVLITDGYVDVEKEAFEFVRNNNNNSNFFCFGIGSSVNRYLLEGLAFMGNGEPMIVTDAETASMQAEKFKTYISTPVLTQIKVDYGAFQAYDIEPLSVSDVLAQRPILIFGKYKGSRNAVVTVSGKTGRQPYSQSFDLSAVKPKSDYSAIKYLWARERIKMLDYYSSNNNSYRRSIDDFIKNEITQLGLKYGLMTQFTSFIAIDEKFIVDKDGKRVVVKQPLPLPQGVSNSAIGNGSQDGYTTSNVPISVADVKGVSNGMVDIADVKCAVTEVSEEKIWDVIEQMPTFPGGDSALMTFLSQNIKYPESDQLSGIQGKVILGFVVAADGSIRDVVVLRSVSPAIDKEAVRVVKNMPKWIPGKQNGVNVAVRYTLPVVFSLTK